MKKSLVFSIITLCLLTSAVSAEIITVLAEGVVRSVNVEGRFQLDGSVSVGTLMEGIFVYDTDTAPIHSGSDYSLYALQSASMNFGNYTFMPA